MDAHFEVYVSKEDFKFNCAHFISFKGFRERLHGHNYRISIKVVGTDRIQDDGYVIDFGDVKKAGRALCKELNEYFICPMKSNDLKISLSETQLCIECEDGSNFSFPKSDCKFLPIYHSSAEEIAHYIWCALVRKIGFDHLISRGVQSMEVGVAEAPFQSAHFNSKIPDSEEKMIEIQNLVSKLQPQPCLGEK